MTNIFRCNACGRMVIAEELETHQCKTITESRIEPNLIWVTDGERWYPLKRHTKINTPKEHTDGETV